MSAVRQSTSILSADALRRIERETAKFPPERRQSAVIAALAIAQDEHGWLSKDVIEAVAAVLDMPAIAVFEVASFYTMYNAEPLGRFKLTVCTNLPCALSGAGDAVRHLKDRLGVDFNETTGDGLFTLKEGECMGACGDAPVMLVNNRRMESFMSNEKLDALLEELRAQGEDGK
jgi:NADH-quinone oxidoreductase subunit E